MPHFRLSIPAIICLNDVSENIIPQNEPHRGQWSNDHMKRQQPEFWQPWPKAAQFLRPAVLLLATSLSPAAAQDIRGIEVCTAEKQMERRTGCLQANVEFLQQALIKLARETQEKIAASDRDLAAARAEIAALKSTMEKLTGELTQMKVNAAPNAKK